MPSKLLTDAQRFWPKVDKRGPDECWPWMGARIPKGYGRLNRRIDGRNVTIWAHRLGWELAHGKRWTEGLLARHSCDNPWCVNPAHITPGTPHENNMDSVVRGRHASAAKTHCKNGHPLSGDNLLNRPHGWRGCKECHRRVSLAWHQKQKEKA